MRQTYTAILVLGLLLSLSTASSLKRGHDAYGLNKAQRSRQGTMDGTTPGGGPGTTPGGATNGPPGGGPT